MNPQLSVREMTLNDIPPVVDYFVKADDDFLKGMGADREKLPDRANWISLITDDLSRPCESKKFYYIIWLINGEPCGHSNINKIEFGKSAALHLHLWPATQRRSGMGLKFIELSIPYFFEKFRLKTLFCEPFANNPAPNKTLKKYGFEFSHAYEGTPGWISYHQIVNLYQLTRKKFEEITVKATGKTT